MTTKRHVACHRACCREQDCHWSPRVHRPVRSRHIDISRRRICSSQRGSADDYRHATGATGRVTSHSSGSGSQHATWTTASANVRSTRVCRRYRCQRLGSRFSDSGLSVVDVQSVLSFTKRSCSFQRRGGQSSDGGSSIIDVQSVFSFRTVSVRSDCADENANDND